MLRNIPNKYTQMMLLQKLYDDGYKSLVDFLYMPMDFKHNVNLGYAFINFRCREAYSKFVAEYHLKSCHDKLPGFRSQKVCEAVPARIQGRSANVERLRQSPVMATLVEYPKWLPMLFDTAGQTEMFPIHFSL